METSVGGFQDRFSVYLRANSSGSTMLDVDRRAYGNFITFAIGLQSVESGAFHEADHVRRGVDRRQGGMMRGEGVAEFYGLVGLAASADGRCLHLGLLVYYAIKTKR